MGARNAIPTKSAPTPDDEAQHQRFVEMARELGCDEDEAAFDAAVKKLAESKPLPKHEPKKQKNPRKGRGI